MPFDVLSNPWKLYPTKQWLYGHYLPSHKPSMEDEQGSMGTDGEVGMRVRVSELLLWTWLHQY